MKTPKAIAEKIIKLNNTYVLSNEPICLNWMRPSERKVLFNTGFLGADFPLIDGLLIEFNPAGLFNTNSDTHWKVYVTLTVNNRAVGFVHYFFKKLKDIEDKTSWDLIDVAIYLAQAK